MGKPTRSVCDQRALTENPDAKAVAVVHGETSTSILNPVKEIGAVVGSTNAIFIVDAVSSLGGLPFDLEGWNVDLCASATQKCLGALPGLAPVAVGPKAWKMIDRANNKAHGWYTICKIGVNTPRNGEIGIQRLLPCQQITSMRSWSLWNS
jgi:alanine-glyoxylate transaminase/serine-glyoxylate transaminase/serine-pyruvate transaminase